MGKSIWVKVFGSSGEQDTDKKFIGYESDAYGLALGIEKNIDEKLSIGLSLGTSAIEVNGDKNADSDIDSYHFGLYGKHNTTEFFIESALSYAVSSIDMKTGSFTPEFNVAWLHEFENSKDDIDYTIAGGTQVHKSEIRAAESDRFKVGLGTGFKINENFDLNVNYDHEFSSDYSSDSISALLSYKF